MSAADHPSLSGPPKTKVCTARREVQRESGAWLLDCVHPPGHGVLHKDITGKQWDEGAEGEPGTTGS
ncbi:hypothetical protein [Prescottella equi]|uniref:hypothetical protein n=1 Tax=Rhodococcus hoagii TaxID=43767 RepID=UPI00131B7A9F|nr:hypothetical protein [Prescottella equi]